MDNDLLDLADRLATVAGMIMEDHSLTAISTPKSADERHRQLDTLAVAGEDIVRLVAAAKMLVRLG